MLEQPPLFVTLKGGFVVVLQDAKKAFKDTRSNSKINLL